MSLVADIKKIQRAVGAEPDGVFGPESAAAVIAHLVRMDMMEDDGHRPPLQLDERTVKNIATLDPKARTRFEQFTKLAKATAATFGCDYIAISGNRTWAAQDALYAQPTDGKDNDGDGRVDEADEKVTNARGGESNHNFGIALDFGVFKGASYLDNTDPGLAAKVHKACSVHAQPCGLEWGGTWNGFKDLPHYEIKTGLTLARKRALYQQSGSVL